MEFALVLPLLITVMWLGVESVLLVRDQTLVTHAAREAARAAAVGTPDLEAERLAAARSGLGGPPAFTVGLWVVDGVVRASARLRESSRLPLLGRIAPSLAVSADISMRVESEP